MQKSEDEAVFSLARRENRVIVSADTDFGMILALRKARGPSLVLFRRTGGRTPQAQAATLINNADAWSKPLDAGAVIVVEDKWIRIRPLPIAEPKY